MDKAEQILDKHINENDLNFIFHEKKDLWQELLNAVNEALGLAHVVGRSEQFTCSCERPPAIRLCEGVESCLKCGQKLSK